MTNSGPHILAVDAMGGDMGPSTVVPGVIASARKQKISLLLVGDKQQIVAELNKLDVSGLDIDIVHASEYVKMDEKPAEVLRKKKDASIQVASRLVKNGEAHGLVSAGHSGATVACGMFVIGRINGVDRPALASILPTESTPTILLDVGANVDSKPYHLFQFALMGEAFARDFFEKDNPNVGLLSIGEEEGKGNIQVKEAYKLIKLAEHLNFIGNIEGRDIFTGQVNVAVCDGFVGNVALKLAEGMASSLTRGLKKELLGSGLIPKFGTFLAQKALKRFAQVVDYAEYGGAPLLGLKNIVVICHGASNSKAIQNATTMASQFIIKKTNDRLIQSISANEALLACGQAS